jgi:hypothetical protein
MVERTFPDGLHIPINDEGARAACNVVNVNTEEGVTWVHSYVSDDKKKTFCIYDGPSPEAIRKVASCWIRISTGSYQWPVAGCPLPTVSGNW